VLLLSDLVIDRSAEGGMAAVSVSVAELLLLSGSEKLAPPGMTILAVLTRFPVVPDATVPLIVKVSKLPAPAFTAALSKRTLIPEVLLVPQLAEPLGAQVTASPLMAVGTLSRTLKPEALSGPALRTTTW